VKSSRQGGSTNGILTVVHSVYICSWSNEYIRQLSTVSRTLVWIMLCLPCPLLCPYT